MSELAAFPPGEKIRLNGIFGSARSILAASIFKKTGKNILLLLPEKEDAATKMDDAMARLEERLSPTAKGSPVLDEDGDRSAPEDRCRLEHRRGKPRARPAEGGVERDIGLDAARALDHTG